MAIRKVARKTSVYLDGFDGKEAGVSLKEIEGTSPHIELYVQSFATKDAITITIRDKNSANVFKAIEKFILESKLPQICY